MIRNYIYRLNDWFNSRGEWTQIILYFGFCLVFVALLLLSIWQSAFKMNTGQIIQPRTSTTK
jgi:hypothetical protein